jgi:hypothetical protein
MAFGNDRELWFPHVYRPSSTWYHVHLRLSFHGAAPDVAPWETLYPLLGP